MKADPLVWLLNAPRRTQQAIAIGTFVLGLAIAVGTVWLAFSSLEQARLSVLEKREMLGRLQAIADLKPMLIESNGVAEAAADAFLSGESEAIVRGNLQSQLNTLVTSSAANLLSIGNVQDLEIGGSRYVGMRVDLAGPVEAVYNTVLLIEGNRAMLINEASIWRSGSGLQNTVSAPEVSAQIRVYGALHPKFSVDTGGEP